MYANAVGIIYRDENGRSAPALGVAAKRGRLSLLSLETIDAWNGSVQGAQQMTQHSGLASNASVGRPNGLGWSLQNLCDWIVTTKSQRMCAATRNLRSLVVLFDNFTSLHCFVGKRFRAG